MCKKSATKIFTINRNILFKLIGRFYIVQSYTFLNIQNDIIRLHVFLIYLNSATVSINRLLDSKLSLWCIEALFECCISRDKPFHPLTPPSDLRQYAVENRQEI